MILTCDECQTRYLLPGGLLGAEGRRVRCSQCAHEWFQEPEEGESFADTLAKADPIPDSVKPDHEYEFVETEKPVLPVYTEAVAETATLRSGGGMAGYLLAGAVLLIALGGSFVFSASVVRMWPSTLAVYQALHIAPSLPGDGLLIDRVQAEVVSGDRGLNILKISGYAMNRREDKKTVAVPPLRVTLRRKGGEDIDSWLIVAPQDELEYESEVAFKTTYPAPPLDAKEVNVRLEPFATVAHVERDGDTPKEEAAPARHDEPVHKTAPKHDAAPAAEHH
jgi:predicted Zn finger-like uncharacterized protein